MSPYAQSNGCLTGKRGMTGKHGNHHKGFKVKPGDVLANYLVLQLVPDTKPVRALMRCVFCEQERELEVKTVKKKRTKDCWCRHDASVERRFWERVERRGDVECWPWIGNTLSSDRGQIALRGEKESSSRAAWFFTHGYQEPDGHVLHHCDNAMCCNPRHLYVGTPADNSRDMVERNRCFRPTGERHHAAVLSESQVREIRSRYKSGTKISALGSEYRVSPTTIADVVRKRTWTHVL